MALLEHLVQIFFVSALVLGAMLKLQPQFFGGVAVPGQAVDLSHRSSAVADGSSDVCSCPDSTSGVGGLDGLFTDNPRLLKLEVNDNSYSFALSSTHPNYIRAKAFEFCVQNKEMLKISRQALMNGCVNPIANQIAMEVKNSPAVFYAEVADPPIFPPGKNVLLEEDSPVVHINIPLADGRNFHFSFDVTATSLINVAERFCSQNAAALELQKEEELVSCIKTVVPFVKQQLVSVGFRDADEERASEPAEQAAVAAAEENTSAKNIVSGFFSIGSMQLPYEYEHAKSPRENAETFCDRAWETVIADALAANGLQVERATCAEFVEDEANKSFQMKA